MSKTKSHCSSKDKPGEGGTPIQKGQGCSSYLSGVKKAVLVPLSVFSLKRSTAGALAILFRVLSPKIMTETFGN